MLPEAESSWFHGGAGEFSLHLGVKPRLRPGLLFSRIRQLTSQAIKRGAHALLMHIQKTAALVSAVFFLTSFTVIPALTIVAHPAQSRVEETVVTELAQQALPTVSAQDVSISFRLVSLDDAELAARIVEPDHVTSEVTFSPEPSATADTPTQATTGHTPAPTLTLLAAPDLTQSEETLSRGKSASPNPAAAPLIRMPWFAKRKPLRQRGCCHGDGP